MSDNPRKKKLDAKFISLKQKHERRYWPKALGVTLERLEAAIEECGTNSVRIIRNYMRFDPWTEKPFDE